MFCSQHNEPPHLENPTIRTKKNRRNKKKHITKQANRRNLKKNYTKLACNMSSWAESFTKAATWQLKHQVAFWKARTLALQYENDILHDIIRKYHGGDAEISTDNKIKTPTKVETNEEMLTENENADYYQDDDDQEEDIEVSEEYIQFLNANAKYREDAKRERERLKAKEEAEELASNMMELQRESVKDTREALRDLYGDKWQKISAVEMSQLSSFINECDQRKAVYWPNIPLNLG